MRLSPLSSLVVLGLLCSGVHTAPPARLAAAQSPAQGVDVSYWQGPSINWQQVAQSGISFAYIRAGEGATYDDPYFASNWSRASGTGIVTGAYLFFHPAQDPVAQADNLIQQLSTVDFGAGELPPAIDVETNDNLPPSTVTTNLAVTVNTIESAVGVVPAIYASPKWWDQNVASSAFTGDPLWVACWCGSTPSLPASGWGGNGYQVWQYTSSGTVPGISGAVDLDVGNPGVPTFTGAMPPLEGVALRAGGTSGYTLDAYGGIHAFGGAPAVTASAYWPGWNIARGIVLRADGQSGYTLDGWGGIHPFGGAPPVPISSYWSGWDIARGLVLRPDGQSGYMLDGWGGVHPFGGAPAVTSNSYWVGWDIARGIALLPGGSSGYTLDGWGGVHPFGGAPSVQITGYWPGWDIARGLVLARGPDTLAYPASSGWVLDGWGGVHSFGGAPSATFPATPYHGGYDVDHGIAFDPETNHGVLTSNVLVPAAFSAAIPPGRALAVSPSTGSASGYALDGAGGLTPFGGAGPVTGAPSWPQADVARGVALRSDGASGYVVDEYGDVLPFGGAASVSTSSTWPGQDEARGLALRADGASGYVLDEFGNIWPFGGAPALSPSQTWTGDVARGITLLAGGGGGYVLDAYGALHPFGVAPALSTGIQFSFDIARSVALLTPTSGYVLDGWGGVHAFGGAPAVTGSGYWANDDLARAIALTTTSTPTSVQGVVLTAAQTLLTITG